MTNVKHKNEDEYFLKQDAELIKAHRARLDEERRQTERKSHHMKCPSCGADLKEREFHHVKVDECPECGGMWLNKGEIHMLTHVQRGSLSRFIGDMLGIRHQ